jgi:hypothetical protein
MRIAAYFRREVCVFILDVSVPSHTVVVYAME